MSNTSRLANRIHRQAVGLINGSVKTTKEEANRQRSDSLRRNLKSTIEKLVANLPGARVRSQIQSLVDPSGKPFTPLTVEELKKLKEEGVDAPAPVTKWVPGPICTEACNRKDAVSHKLGV